MQIIPLTNNPSAVFDINIDALQYTIVTKYNTRAGTWSIDLFESGVLLTSGIGLLLGVDIVRQYNYNIGVLFMADLDRLNLDATGEDLGTRVVLVQATQEEYEQNINLVQVA